MAEDENVKVFCRVRPPNEREQHGIPTFFARNSSSSSNTNIFVKKCVSVPTSDPLQQTVFLHLKHGPASASAKPFTFDRVFGETSTQMEVFEIVGAPITRACLQGYNGTIFAYGQTGSGKTFTMQGPEHLIEEHSTYETDLRGLVPRVFDYLFQETKDQQASSSTTTKIEYKYTCSFLEIYNERVYDLLDGGNASGATGLQLRENARKGVVVEGLIESDVTSARKAAELMRIGAQNRRVGQTAMNRESSRSHSVFILQIQSKETTLEGITKTRSSRFNLVDLAGSERQKSTETIGDRLKEAGSINKSLSALGNVIMGLVEQSAGKNRHVHYRDSKLTFLLKDSLGGNAKTFMIATISPAEDSSNETLSTLKFAQRAKLIRNNAIINEDTSGSILVLQEEILRLRKQLQQQQQQRPYTPSRSNSMTTPRKLPFSTPTRSQSMGMISVNTPSSTSDKKIKDDIDTEEKIRDLENTVGIFLKKNDILNRQNEFFQVKQKQLKDLKDQMKHITFS
jgi:kinesin family protein 15